MKFDRSKFSDCKNCPLRDQTRVYGTGPYEGSVSLVIIGGCPTSQDIENQDESISPFHKDSTAGKLLNKALFDAHLFRRRIWTTNLIACKPPWGDMECEESQEAIKCCAPGFKAELEYLKTKRKNKVQILTDNSLLEPFKIEGSIRKNRGSVYETPFGIAVPTYHPDFIRRDGYKHAGVWTADLEKAATLSRTGFQATAERFNWKPTLVQVRRFVKTAIRNHYELGSDIETTSLKPYTGVIVMIGYAWTSEDGICVPFYKQQTKKPEKYWSPTEEKEVIKLLDELHAKVGIFFQNGFFDITYMLYHSFKMPQKIIHDTMVLMSALDPELEKNLGFITSLYGSTPYWKDDFLNREGSIFNLEAKKVRIYNLRDCAVLKQVLPGMLEDAKHYGILDNYQNITIPMIPCLIDMKMNGIPLSTFRLKKFEKEQKANLVDIETQLREITKVHKDFNFSSDDDMRYLLFGVIPNKVIVAEQKAAQYEEKLTELNLIIKEVKDAIKQNKVAQKAKSTTIKEKKKFLSKNKTLEKKLKQKKEQFNRTRSTATYANTYTTLAVANAIIPCRPTKNGRAVTGSGALSVNDQARLRLLIYSIARIALVKKFKRPTADHKQEILDYEKLITIINLFNKYQELSKLISTYTSFPIWPDRRIHPTFDPTGTANGRLASRNPNGQNFPFIVKIVFYPGKGRVIIEGDFSNLELRVISYIADDYALQKLFAEGKNAHDENCRTLMHLEPDHPQWKTARKAMKTYRFGRNYGGGLRGIYDRVIAQVPDLRLTFQEFCTVDEAYNEQHPEYAKWFADTEVEVVENKRLVNAFGRHRIFHGTDSSIKREGLNFPIQSTAADIMNQCMVAYWKEAKEKYPDALLCGQVHDSLLLDVAIKDKDNIIKLLLKHLERPFTLTSAAGNVYKDVRFPIDIKVGPSWGEAKDIDLTKYRKRNVKK